jgi:hypothetical protein
MATLSAELSAEVRAVAAVSRIRALILLRTATGCSLREARDTLQILVPIPAMEDNPPCAEVLAFGRFTAALSDFMDYRAESFAGVEAGTAISVWIVEAVGTDDVAQLAEAVGIVPEDMNQWHLRPEAIDAPALEEGRPL